MTAQTSRARVYAAIDWRRRNQDWRYEKDAHSIGEELVVIGREIQKLYAINYDLTYSASTITVHFRDIAATCVRCMEHWGAQYRNGPGYPNQHILPAPVSRADIYEVIDSERAYQDSMWPQEGDEVVPNPLSVAQAGASNPLSIAEFVLMLDDYFVDARRSWRLEKQPELATLNIIRKLAGIAVNCMEQHGAPMEDTFAC